MVKSYFSYVRVSTTRQGQTGTSLHEQREAIRRYAARFNLSIVKEYEEQETAAKRGRPVFAEMLHALRKGRIAGVIMHKIDRSARNLKDWADLGELIDSGVEVHFANESLDLNSRGGRLSADIQAVVAADYIRNLREESKKGIYGRLKQGLYPMPAPIGYLDRGQGQPKAINPVQATFVKQAFELYATGQYSLRALTEKMNVLGLRSKHGSNITCDSVNKMLKNPFYTGLIRIKKSGEYFTGIHKPLVARSTFDRVQMILSGKRVEKQHRHLFLFRKHLTCVSCKNFLIAEIQKGYTYYRCQTKHCPQKTVREEVVEAAFTSELQKLRFDEWEMQYFRKQVLLGDKDKASLQESQVKSLNLQLDQVKERLSRLSDAYLDGVFDQESYLHKKNNLLVEQQIISERLENAISGDDSLKRAGEFLERVNMAYSSYESGIFEEQRELVKVVTSNFEVRDKFVLPKLRFPFRLVAEREKGLDGGPHRDVARTLSPLLSILYAYVAKSKDVMPFDATDDERSFLPPTA